MSELRVITAEELKSILAKHVAWLEDEGEGVCADLSNANLCNADLCDANLCRADLSRANLCNADLSDANLRNANLRSANLRSADLRRADLRDANLCNANLSYADLSNADLRNADLSYANLSYADLRRADLSRANLCNANLCNANLILVGQDIRGYLFWSFVGDSGAVELRAGCRWLKGISAMRSHWQARHTGDEILREDCLSLVDRCERMAKARGWKLEPEA